MAVVHVGKVRVYSTSPTARSRDRAIGHILRARLDEGPAYLERHTLPGGFAATTACSSSPIAVTMYVPTQLVNGRTTANFQRPVKCARCRADREGGELDMFIELPTTIYSGLISMW